MFLHINSTLSVRYTMELEQNEILPFLYVLANKKTDGTLCHTMYRKTAHTDLILLADLGHHPTQTRTVSFSYPWSTNHSAPTANLQNYEYICRDIQYALRDRIKPLTASEKLTEVDLLPYHRFTHNKITRLLARCNIKTTHIRIKNIPHL